VRRDHWSARCSLQVVQGLAIISPPWPCSNVGGEETQGGASWLTKNVDQPMTPEIMTLLVILGGALMLFITEWVSADVVGLGVLVLLILTGLLPAKTAFEGFGSDTVLMIFGLFILTAALLRTGVVDLAGRFIVRRAGDRPERVLAFVMLGAAALSAFISNTAATAFFLPVAIGAALRTKISPSQILLPLAFGSILTSSVTLVSTSTNIVVSGVITNYGQPPIGMFELAPVGIPIAIVGLAYMWFFGRRLIPARAAAADLAEEFGLGSYLTDVLILPNSKLVGKTLSESGLGRDLDLTVMQIVRDKTRALAPRATTMLEAGDVLLVEGQRDEILKIKDTAGIEIKADATLSFPELQTEDTRLAEVMLMPRSPLIGRTLKGIEFRERYGLQVLAINRAGASIRNKISQVRLHMGDVLLVQGHRENLAAIDKGDTVRVLGALQSERPKLRRAPVAILIFIGALGAATFGLVSLPVAVLVGAVLVFLTRCLTPEEAYREVEWKVLVLIGSMLALGAAMERTGTARFLAARIVDLAGDARPMWLLSGFFGLTVLLTQPMSNQAAAVVVVPIAVQMAMQLDLNPRTFAMMIAIAASTSYMTPLEPSCLMVYGPGRYRFVDFLKVGTLLTLLIYGVAILLVPRVWPL